MIRLADKVGFHDREKDDDDASAACSTQSQRWPIERFDDMNRAECCRNRRRSLFYQSARITDTPIHCTGSKRALFKYSN